MPVHRASGHRIDIIRLTKLSWFTVIQECSNNDKFVFQNQWAIGSISCVGNSAFLCHLLSHWYVFTTETNLFFKVVAVYIIWKRRTVCSRGFCSWVKTFSRSFIHEYWNGGLNASAVAYFAKENEPILIRFNVFNRIGHRIICYNCDYWSLGVCI